MPQKGTYTALQKLKPIEVDWEKSAKAGVEREDLLYNRKVAEEKRRKEERDKIDYDTQEAVITGIDSLDKGITLGIQEASTIQHEDYKRALNDPSFADSPDYKIRAKNLNNYSKNIKAFSDGFSELAQSTIAKSQDGSLSSWDDDLLATLNGGFVSEKVKFGTAPDGSVQAWIASTDQSEITDENPDGYIKDEDGKIKLTKVTPNEVFKGLGKFSVTPDVDIQKQATDIGTELGKSIESSVDGYTITSEQSWETKKEDTRKIVRGMLGSPKSLTPLAKRLWADEMGEESRNLSEADMVKLEDKMLEKVKPFYDQEVKKTKNYAAQESARKRAQEKTEGDVSPEYVVDPESGAATVTQVNGVDANIISFGDGKGITTVDTEARKESVQNIYVDKNGKIFADKVEEDKAKGDPVYIKDAQGKNTTEIDWVATTAQKSAKGWETKTKPKVQLTDTDFTNLAKNRNMVDDKGNRFKDGRALKAYLEKRKELLPKNQTKKSSAGDAIFK